MGCGGSRRGVKVSELGEGGEGGEVKGAQGHTEVKACRLLCLRSFAKERVWLSSRVPFIANTVIFGQGLVVMAGGASMCGR